MLTSIFICWQTWRSKIQRKCWASVGKMCSSARVRRINCCRRYKLSEVVLGGRGRRGGINITSRCHNVTFCVHCLLCNLKFSSDFYCEQRFLLEQMRWRLPKEAASFIKTVLMKSYLRSHRDRNPIYRMTFSKCVYVSVLHSVVRTEGWSFVNCLKSVWTLVLWRN